VLGALKFKAPQRNVTIALLLLILAAAFVLRGMQAWFGIPYLHYWDEPQTASTALNIIKSGDLNPHFFHYGSLLIYACVLADFVYYFFAHDLSLSSSLHLDSISDVVTNADTNWPWTISHPQFYVADRFLIVLFGVGTVAVTYLIGARLLPVGFALGAAAFLATSPFHVGHSYVDTTDVPVAFFVITATWALLVFLEEKATWGACCCRDVGRPRLRHQVQLGPDLPAARVVGRHRRLEGLAQRSEASDQMGDHRVRGPRVGVLCGDALRLVGLQVVLPRHA